MEVDAVVEARASDGEARGLGGEGLALRVGDGQEVGQAALVAGARQVAQGGAWVDAPLAAATVQRIEEIILTKARDLRRTALAGD